MKRLTLALATLPILLAASAHAAAPQIDVPLMQRMVERLASDELEGRAPSTATTGQTEGPSCAICFNP